MKKSYIRTIIGSYVRGYVLIILFQLYGSRLGFLKVVYSGWVNMIPSSTFILEEELVQY